MALKINRWKSAIFDEFWKLHVEANFGLRKFNLILCAAMGLEQAGIGQNMLELAGINSNILELSTICWHMLEIAGVGWKLLE